VLLAQPFVFGTTDCHAPFPLCWSFLVLES
jgi:hypothetical protein